MMDFSLPRIAGFLPRPRRRDARPVPRVAIRIALTAVALAALVALSALASSNDPGAERVAVVMDSSVAHDPARRAAADEWLRTHGAASVAPRIAAGPTQQLSVTSTLAVRGYDVIVAVGLDRRVAIDPVVQRYPALRVVRD
jgi:hypothetical protein